MVIPEPTNPKKSSSSSTDQRQLDREVREMLSTLTHRLTDLHHHSSNKSHDSTQLVDEEEEHGVRIITLAGSNTGATMKAESEEKSFGISASSLDDEQGMTAYANSNFQAINNSIMLGGSYSCKDPGIHMVTSQYVEEHEHHNKAMNKHGKRKVTGTSRRDSHSTQDDQSTSDSDE